MCSGGPQIKISAAERANFVLGQLPILTAPRIRAVALAVRRGLQAARDRIAGRVLAASQ
jgi:hypothetical protein